MDKVYKHKLDISDIKRLYVKGLIIKENCPKCEKELKIDYSENYFTYEDGEKTGEELAFICKDCGIEWVCDATIKAEIEVKITSKLKEY